MCLCSPRHSSLVTRHSSLVNSAPGDAFLAGADVFCAATHTVKNALADSASRAKGTAQRKYATVVNYTCNQGWVGDGSMECKVRLPPRPHGLPTLVVVVMMHVVVAPCTRHEAFRAFRTMCF